MWETAADFGDQRIYASGTAIMFSRESCYFFVRPKRSFLQVCVFLGRTVRSPLVRRVERKSSKSKLANIVHVSHRDEVESPLVDWLREAYDLPGTLIARSAKASPPRKRGVGRAKGPPAFALRFDPRCQRIRFLAARASVPMKSWRPSAREAWVRSIAPTIPGSIVKLRSSCCRLKRLPTPPPASACAAKRWRWLPSIILTSARSSR